MRPTAPPLRPGFFPRASRSPPHPRGKLPAAAKASPSFAPDPAPLASLRAPPNTAIRPKSAPSPPQIARSMLCGKRREGTAPPPARELPEWASPSPTWPAVPGTKSAPSIILHDGRHQPRRKVLRHAIQRRILLFKKILDAVWIVGVRRNLVLVAEDKIVCAIENLPCRPLFERDLALQRNQHGRRAPRRSIKQQRHRFQAQHFAAQYRIPVRRVGHHAVGSLRQKFMHRGGSQSLFDAVAG